MNFIVAAGVPAAPEIAATIEGGSPAFKILQPARLPLQNVNQGLRLRASLAFMTLRAASLRYHN